MTFGWWKEKEEGRRRTAVLWVRIHNEQALSPSGTNLLLHKIEEEKERFDETGNYIEIIRFPDMIFFFLRLALQMMAKT